MLVIDLSPRRSECAVCGTYLEVPSSGGGLGVPMYEGLVLPNDWDGEWGGFDACRRCYEWQGGLTAPSEPPVH